MSWLSSHSGPAARDRRSGPRAWPADRAGPPRHRDKTASLPCPPARQDRSPRASSSHYTNERAKQATSSPSKSPRNVSSRRALRSGLAAIVVVVATLSAPGLLRAQDFDQPAAAQRPPAPEAPAAAPKLTKAPAVKKSGEAKYPPDALEERPGADVTVLIDIDAEGHVTNVQVTKPAGHGFDEAAAAAASEMEFTPAEIDGKPGKIRIEYVLHFPVPPEPAA